jgi:hypothetical protein
LKEKASGMENGFEKDDYRLRGKEMKSSRNQSSFLTGPYASDNLIVKDYQGELNGRTGFFRISR